MLCTSHAHDFSRPGLRHRDRIPAAISLAQPRPSGCDLYYTSWLDAASCTDTVYYVAIPSTASWAIRRVLNALQICATATGSTGCDWKSFCTWYSSWLRVWVESFEPLFDYPHSIRFEHHKPDPLALLLVLLLHQVACHQVACHREEATNLSG